mgnify:CR=1 FL=1
MVGEVRQEGVAGGAAQVGRRQLRGLGRAQAGPLLALEVGVVLLLERRDDGAGVVVALDLGGDRLLVAAGAQDEVVVGQVEPGDVDDGVEGGERPLGPLGPGQVVRHVDREADGLVAGLAEPHLEQGADRPGHLHPPERGDGVADERGVGGVRGHADGAGVRHRHRDAVRVHHQRDAQAHDELADGLDDPLPLVVGLGAGEHVGVRALGDRDGLAHRHRDRLAT